MSDKHYTHHDDQTHLESALRQAKPWLETNATFLIYGLAAILAVAAGIIWFQRQPVANAAASALFQEASEPEDYQAIADEYGDTKLGNLARLNQATGLLNSASRNLFTDREAAKSELEQAEAALNRLAENSGLDAMLHERVLIGKARLAEIRCDGSEESRKAAASAWQTVLDEYETSMAKELAEGQIKALNDPDNAAFYAWFSELEPKPADDLNMPGLMPGMGGSGPGSTVPDIPGNLTLPTFPDALIDDTPEAEKGKEPAEAAEETSETETLTEEPASEEPKPADDPAESGSTEEPAVESTESEEPSTPTEEPAVEEPTEPAE
jgi:predicted negative regulator of RcsB-dependent stress response